MHINDLPELTLLHHPNGEMSEVYEQIHALGSPGVFRSPDGDGLIVTSYAALHTLRKSPHMQSLRRNLRVGGSGTIGAPAQVAAYNPFFVDEPMHTPLAAVTYRLLGPKRQESIEEDVSACVTNALESVLSQETCDLVEGYARRITSSFWVREIGAPASMAQSFCDWSMAIQPMLAFECSQAQIATANQATAEMWDYLLDLEKTVGEESLLIRLAQDIQGMPDRPKHGADIIAAITFDGIDSAAGAIANLLYVVLRDEELQALLRKHPEQIDNAVWEALRLETPLPVLQRATTAPITYTDNNTDIDIPEGINIHMAWGCAGRDPNAYEEPNTFRLNRKNRTSLAFGGGERFCKGRTLALIQCSVALKHLLENTEWIELLNEPNWSPPGSIRTVDVLECLID